MDRGHQFCVGVADNDLSVQYVSHIDGEEAALSFITDITQILEISVQRTKTNVLEAARVMPSHGKSWLVGNTHRVCDLWLEVALVWTYTCGAYVVYQRFCGVKNCLWLHVHKKNPWSLSKWEGIVFRFQVSVHRRYVHNSDERRH